MKLFRGLLVLFITTPVWYFLMYSIIKAIHPDRLVWFLFWIYLPLGMVLSILQIVADRSGEKEMSDERFPEDVINKLTQPIDPQALSQAPRGLTSIKSIYVTERLNEAFGFGRWQIIEQVITVTEPRIENRTDRAGKVNTEVILMPMVVVRVSMLLLDYPWFQAWSYGGNDNPDLGDAYKGAVTDAISKMCAMYLGIAQDVFKGLPPERGPQKTKEQIQAEAKAKVEVIKAQMPPNPDLTAQLKGSIAETYASQEPGMHDDPVSEGYVADPEAAPGENDCFDPEKCISKKQAGLFWVNATKNHSAADVKKALAFKGLSSIYKCPKEPRTIFDSLLKWAQKQ